jgi:hypothetical protein
MRFWLLMMYLSTNSASLPRQESVSPVPRTFEKMTGSSRIELAKMIGMTPAWFTFSGM